MADDISEKTSVLTGDTIRGRLADVDSSPPSLVMLMGPAGQIGKQWPISESGALIGRSPDCQIFVDDKSLSRQHAKLGVSGSDVTILDLNSTNKTQVNGVELAPMAPKRLATNDQVKTGNVIFKYLERGSLEAISNRDMYERAHKDALTGAFMKGALIARANELFKRIESTGEPLSVAVLDIDFFKKINDTYGHDAGDYVLKEMASVILKKMIRTNDFFARYGGEEFVLLLMGTTLKFAIDVAERVRSTIEGHKFVYDKTEIPVTVSLGVATKDAAIKEWTDLFKKADAALYMSKQNGRNRVSMG